MGQYRTERSTARDNDKVRPYEATSGPSGYQYGWPSGGTSENNVAVQWLFDESGSAVDEVAGVTLATVGTPSYQTAATGDWANLSPGMTFDGSANHMHKATTSSELNIAADQDHVIEFVAAVDAGWTTGTKYSFSYVANSGNYGHMMTVNRGTDVATMVTYGDGFAHYKSCAYNLGTDWRDGNPHKWRIVFDRDGNQELFINGSSKGTFDISANTAATYTNEAIRIPGQYNGGGGDWQGTLYEHRFTIGNASNDSGGGD